MQDLRTYLHGRGLFFAPDSPSRILRQLRLAGRVNYVVVNRSRSLYEVPARETNSDSRTPRL